MRYGMLAVFGQLLAASTLQAQVHVPATPRTGAQQWSRLEVRSFTGMYVPRGTHRRDFKAAPTHGVQGAFELAPFARVVASTSWTEGQSTHIDLMRFPRTHIWQYDAGVEFTSHTEVTPKVGFATLVGAGAGARNYYYPDKGMSSIGYPAGYFALGTELHMGSLALRLEGRSYLSSFRPPLESTVFYRDDMTVTFGLTYHVRRFSH